MSKFVRPNVFISACIEFEACRYDGTHISDDFVKRLKEVVKVTRVCPEMMIGLGTPRDSLRLVQTTEEVKLLQSSNGEDLTSKMTSFTNDYIDKLKDKEIDGFILKAKSPSCGIQNVKLYEGLGKARVLSSKHYGIFGGMIKEHFPNKPVETERRISNYQVRDRFFVELFTLASFREIRNTTIKNLVNFHTINKYLFMAYNQTVMKKMGNIVANHNHLPLEEVYALYEENLRVLLSKTASKNRRINVFTHVYGYFKKELDVQEKEYYFELLDDYLNNQIPYTSILSLLRGWVLRFNDEYLKKQTIFEPYPKELVMMLDSGKRI
jgi:uncharacterized protein YbgA (DUF1722 family)/uncharacterized protein YbbK (DUF523 family)